MGPSSTLHLPSKQQQLSSQQEEKKNAGMLTLVQPEVPPYSYSENGQVKGQSVDRARALLARIGWKINVVMQPPLRIWSNLRSSDQILCSAGWYSTTERRQMGRYSLPIKREEPDVTIFRRENRERFNLYSGLIELLQDRSLIFATGRGISYGEEVDSLIEQQQPTRYFVVHEKQTLPMLVYGRADYALGSVEEMEAAVLKLKLTPGQLQYKRYWL